MITRNQIDALSEQELGYLYICCNGLGWYLYNLFSVRNKAKDYNPKIMAINAIENTFEVLNGFNKLSNNELIIPSSVLINDLKDGLQNALELQKKNIDDDHQRQISHIQKVLNEKNQKIELNKFEMDD